MLNTLQGWPRGQGRDAPMSAIYISTNYTAESK